MDPKQKRDCNRGKLTRIDAPHIIGASTLESIPGLCTAKKIEGCICNFFGGLTLSLVIVLKTGVSYLFAVIT